MALPKKLKLNLRLHRQRVESNCRKVHSLAFTLLIASKPEKTSTSTSRFAILISKKLAAKAVDRNKIKRLISQAIQNSLTQLPQNSDIILIPKKSVISASLSEISTDLVNLSN